MYARIISIVDAYDAMTSDRRYRQALSTGSAVNELLKNVGTQFDPELTTFYMNHVVWY